jgi:hypothetical protein
MTRDVEHWRSARMTRLGCGDLVVPTMERFA